MEKKLELKHLAAYLPYRLKVKTEDGIFNADGWSNEIGILLDTIMYGAYCTPKYKLILRPLSDLVYGSPYFNHIYDITTHYHWENSVCELMKYPEEARGMWPQYILDYLLENHFDVFGLIPAGLAISYKEAGL